MFEFDVLTPNLNRTLRGSALLAQVFINQIIRHNDGHFIG
ncbi:hypothetical protein SPWS13_2909 [Shewanella putrefaciens]|nr:hypothetical protein SPWS13_2909 [Shewanella putrefaciens]